MRRHPRAANRSFLWISVFAACLCVSSLSTVHAMTSWLLDTKKYHISAHGQMSCQDCHEGFLEEKHHPNPLNVNKNLEDFFSLEHCLSCHDNVEEDLKEGSHGSKKISDPKEYVFCLRCHDPHYQWRLGETQMGRFDPERPRHEQCGACHKEKSSLPPFYAEDKTCIGCHGLTEPEGPEATGRITRLCFHCHGDSDTKAQVLTGKLIPPINEKEYEFTPHAFQPCTSCHPTAAGYQHRDQKLGNCGRCHFRHPEKIAHEAHLDVSCGACHLNEIRPTRDPVTKQVVWKREIKPGKPSNVHLMFRGDKENSCKRCHFEHNPIGAASMILPAKSILCMPCHAATFSVRDTTTLLSLLVFLFGALTIISYWLTGSIAGSKAEGSLHKSLILLWNAIKTIFSLNLIYIIRALLLDVLLQRRLYKQSHKRWVIHSLIFFPFVIRFSWGMIALLGSVWKPDWPFAWVMLDKNHPLPAFLFDFTGIMVILGISFALIRGYLQQSARFPEMPRQDRLALGLIGAIVVVGFVLEAIRMTMTGWPGVANYAFVGYAISRLLSHTGSFNDTYGYFWYAHAILTGAFIAYLPFSRLAHIIMAPLVLVMNAASDQRHVLNE